MCAGRINCEALLKATLGLNSEEAHLYTLVVYSGRMTTSEIVEVCGWDAQTARRYSIMLVERGMFIEIAVDQFESLHPRFALANQYRKRCLELGLEYKRNDKIDRLATFLERHYESVRTK